MRNFLNKLTFTRHLLIGWLALSLSGFSQADSPTLDRVIKTGVLKVAMSGDQAPFNVVSRQGPVMGLDVDLANAFAAAMNVKLEVVEMPFGELLAALEKNKVDMVMSGVAITPERSKTVSFVGPYMISGKSILTTKSVMGKLKTAGDFNNPEVRLVGLENSTSADFIKRNMPKAKLVTITNYDTGIDMVISGAADAMLADMPICKLAVLRLPGSGLVTLEEPIMIEPVGIAVSSQDMQFLNLVRNYLGTFEKVGLTTELRKKWFENGEWIVALP